MSYGKGYKLQFKIVNELSMTNESADRVFLWAYFAFIPGHPNQYQI